MIVLFIHQNMPGQFVHLVRALAADKTNQVVFITQRRDVKMSGVMKITYEPPQLTPPIDLAIAEFQRRVNNGRLVAKSCELLKARGIKPDIIIGHPGWGELLFVKDVFPDTALIDYCEYFGVTGHPGQGAASSAGLTLDSKIARRLRSAHLLLSLSAADGGLSPTEWQRSLHPEASRGKIEVIFDGVDTSVLKPDAAATFTLPTGDMLTREDEIVTYAARALEPTRGFPTFMRAIPSILAKRPNCHIVVAGREEGRYDLPPAADLTWLAKMLSEVNFDRERVHFVGHLPHHQYVKLLQISSVHIYLTTPTVLSWSFFDAMAVGCLIVASKTPPVLEVISDAENGFLAPFDEPESLAETLDMALSRDNRDAICRSAIATIKQQYTTAICVPKQIAFLKRLVEKSRIIAGE